jgi:hypothetical protein
MEDIIKELEVLYLTVGFNGLLAALDTYLLRKWDEDGRAGYPSEDLVREIARLKKARRMLTDAEREEVRTQGILWVPKEALATRQ